eukprot:Hpha_TRINITY_DN25931_c0_g1::TRINITY_DN25931_c0_g1_i1::g.185298::m.185298
MLSAVVILLIGTLSCTWEIKADYSLLGDLIVWHHQGWEKGELTLAECAQECASTPTCLSMSYSDTITPITCRLHSCAIATCSSNPDTNWVAWTCMERDPSRTPSPSQHPTTPPTMSPTSSPTPSPSSIPSLSPTLAPSVSPSRPPSYRPSLSPSRSPSQIPPPAPP